MSFLSVPDGWRHVVSDGMSDLAKETPGSLGGRLLCTLGEFYEPPGYQILKHDIALTPEATCFLSDSSDCSSPSQLPVAACIPAIIFFQCFFFIP